MEKTRKTLRIGLIGTQFMGKAHSNAWSQVNHFFPSSTHVVKQAICGRNEERARDMAETWEWKNVVTDWRELIERKDIDLIDICTPNNSHAEIAIAALKAGKHVACEKPLCMNGAEATQMVKAAKNAKLLNTVWYNYRRVPALALAKQLVEQGRLGRIFHVRCVYLQSWIIDPNFPAVWRLDSKTAGSGAHGDLNAHIIDAARFITGDEITEVVAHAETFIKERPTLTAANAASASKLTKGTQKTHAMSKVTVDDAVSILAKFKGGAMGTFEATRFAQGRKNGNRIEINGEKGAIEFAFEDMNRLKFYDASQPAQTQGFTDILATDASHPYFGAYWPAGHIIGYEHTFINQCADIVKAIESGSPEKLQPDFANAAQTQRVLDAALESSVKRKWVKTY
jgi:predicted dehydrogenase